MCIHLYLYEVHVYARTLLGIFIRNVFPWDGLSQQRAHLRLVWLTSQSQGSSCYHLHNARIIGLCYYTWHFYMDSGVKPGSLCLEDKHFAKSWSLELILYIWSLKKNCPVRCFYLALKVMYAYWSNLFVECFSITYEIIPSHILLLKNATFDWLLAYRNIS